MSGPGTVPELEWDVNEYSIILSEVPRTAKVMNRTTTIHRDLHIFCFPLNTTEIVSSNGHAGETGAHTVYIVMRPGQGNGYRGVLMAFHLAIISGS